MSFTITPREILPEGPAKSNDERRSRGVTVAIENVSIAFGGRIVLSNFDIKIAAGEFVAIVGRSGCGKSTLLRSIVGLETPQTGSIALGTVAQGKPDVRIMFQDSRLLPWKRVLQNVTLGLERSFIPHATKILDQVGLADRANDWPAILSGGQRQRVALARALVSRPKLLLLDEPLGALDALTRLDMQRLVEQVWCQQRFTAVLVTHDVGEAVALADWVVVLERGGVPLVQRISQ